MDFNSRDSYRHAIEELSKGSQLSESAIASQALQMAEQGKDPVKSHVGYYLVDKGVFDLEKTVNYKSSWLPFIRRKMILHPVAFYLGSIITFTIGIECLLAFLLHQGHAGLGNSILLLFLALVPSSEIAIQLVTWLATKILLPIILPKLSFEKGIPQDLRTLVVVPSLLTFKDDITQDINQLEIHYLANADKTLRFGIFYDFIDAPEEHMPDDLFLLNVAEKGLKALEDKYTEVKFFLFYRNRSWSKSENAWIGRERKRGKLECLNRFLAEGACPETYLAVGKKEDLHGVRYVITLDADTSLPKDAARHLVETIAHPLNAPQIHANGKISRGFTIIQPRIGTDITHARNTLFLQIFSDAQSINPYNQAVSDIYQDLMSEGNYHGKGIYDVQSFHQVLNNCFPEEHLLSHDLLEGVHVRVGFASDIILTDKFPQDYYAWTKRQHRWMRGDWQIIDWLFSKVPSVEKKNINNPLSFISRWKIFDNLRRSLLPISLLLLLIVAFFTSKVALFWSIFVLSVYFIPTVCMALFDSFVSIKGLVLAYKDLLHQALKACVNIALLPNQAYICCDVIVRVFFRRSISHKKLLEWEKFHPASSREKHQKFIVKLLSVSLFALIIFFLTALWNPLGLMAASLFCTLWFFAPAVIAILDKQRIVELAELLTSKERLFLRYLARKTWRYFDDFVGPQSHWLPPDNYQAALNVEVAQRTSPTNIGLWMLAVLAANDFKYITYDDVLERINATFDSFKKLEMFEGHFLNWYDIQTLKPLQPRYVSTVDSGNLLACFWTLEQGLNQLANDNLMPLSILDGLKDTFNLAFEDAKSIPYLNQLQQLKKGLHNDYKNVSELIDFIRKSLKFIQEFFNLETTEKSNYYWLKQLEDQLQNGIQSQDVTMVE